MPQSRNSSSRSNSHPSSPLSALPTDHKCPKCGGLLVADSNETEFVMWRCVGCSKRVFEEIRPQERERVQAITRKVLYQCPYNILSPPKLSPAIMKKLDRRDVLRFFYVEALLRSKTVGDLFQQAALRTRCKTTAPPGMSVRLWTFLFGQNRLKLRGEKDALMVRLLWDRSLQDRFKIEDGWAVLSGSHHYLLTDRRPHYRIGEGIVNLSDYHQKTDLRFELKFLDEKQSRYLYLMIDTAEVSSGDLKLLDAILHRRQKTKSAESGFFEPHPIQDVRAWLSYLECYDIRRLETISFAKIGERVFGSQKKRSSVLHEAKRACDNVTKLIRNAKKGRWRLPLL